jgi:hypothetical protein
MLRERDEWRTLGVILSAALLLRAALPLASLASVRDPTVFYEPDSGGYVELSRSLLESGEFAINGIPELVRTPGYPLFLVASLLAGRFEAATIVLQICVSLVSVVLVFAIGKLLFERSTIALTAAALYAAEPQSILYCSKILTETLFTTLLLAFAYCLLRALCTQSLAATLTAALCAVGYTLTRPVGFALPFMMLPLLVLAAPGALRRRCVHGAVFLLVTGGLLGAWAARNNLRTDYLGLSSISDVALYFWQGASVISATTGVPYTEVQARLGYFDPEVYYAAHPEQREWTRGRVFRFQRDEGTKILAANPGVYASIHARGILRTFLNPGVESYAGLFAAGTPAITDAVMDDGWFSAAMETFRRSPSVAMVKASMTVLQVTVLLFAAWGLARARWRAAETITIAMMLYLGFVAGGPLGTSRLRHPIMPFVVLWAAVAFAGTAHPKDRGA